MTGKLSLYKAFLDTNILIYAQVVRRGLPSDPRNEIAERLVSEGGAVSAQVLNEFCDVLSRRFGIAWQAIAERIDAITAVCGPAVPLGAHTAQAALSISSRYGFRIYDSLILASAKEAGCDILYTEDLQHGQTIETVRIVNPFL